MEAARDGEEARQVLSFVWDFRPEAITRIALCSRNWWAVTGSNR
jgi:hypothetical protein